MFFYCVFLPCTKDIFLVLVSYGETNNKFVIVKLVDKVTKVYLDDQRK